MEEALRQKPYKDYHISILGFGYLMEYIEDCYHNFLGDGVSGQILGVTADEDGLVRKQEKFSFQILLRDQMGISKFRCWTFPRWNMRRRKNTFRFTSFKECDFKSLGE